MASDLSLKLKIAIKPYSEPLQSALKLGEIFSLSINDVLSGKITFDVAI